MKEVGNDKDQQAFKRSETEKQKRLDEAKLAYNDVIKEEASLSMKHISNASYVSDYDQKVITREPPKVSSIDEDKGVKDHFAEPSHDSI